MCKNFKTYKKQYFKNLNYKNIMNTKKFWTIVKPLFPNKRKTANTIILHENHRIIKDNKKIQHTLNKYFTNLIKTLKLKKDISCSEKQTNTVKHLLKHFKNEFITKIQEHFY